MGFITVTNFFGHWIKEIYIKRYGDDVTILPLTNTVYIYQYSDKILKRMPKEVLKTLQNNILYSKKQVAIYVTNNDRRAHYTTPTAAEGNRIDENLTDRITKFQGELKNECVYRNPLKCLCNVGLGNQCIKLSTKYILTLETDIQKLFETNINQSMDALPTSIDAGVLFTGAPYIMSEKFQSDENFKAYLEGTMQSEHVLRT